MCFVHMKSQYRVSDSLALSEAHEWGYGERRLRGEFLERRLWESQVDVDNSSSEKETPPKAKRRSSNISRKYCTWHIGPLHTAYWPTTYKPTAHWSTLHRIQTHSIRTQAYRPTAYRPTAYNPQHTDPQHSDPQHTDPQHTGPQHIGPHSTEYRLTAYGPKHTDPQHTDPSIWASGLRANSTRAHMHTSP